MTFHRSRTVIIRDAIVHVTSSRTTRGDVVATDGVLTRLGPAGSPDPADALVLDATGASVVPLLIDGAIRALGSHTGPEMKPGNPAVFAVVRDAVSPSRITEMLMISPSDLLAVVLEDRLVVWDGVAVDPGDPGPDWVGAWTDPGRAMTQHLTADGRYSETRNRRVDAYTGCYWTHRDWIAYRDDTEFWAFGQRVDGILHHGGYVLRPGPRQTPR